MKQTEADRSQILSLEQIPKLSQPPRKDLQLYVQIYDILYSLIRDGKAQPGAMIPGEHELAAHFGVSRGTLRQALQYLKEDGLVVKRQGKGSEVAGGTDFMGEGLQEYSDICTSFCTLPISDVRVKWKYTGAGQWLSEQLRLPKGALIVSADLCYYSGQQLVAACCRLIPTDYLKVLAVNPDDQQEMRTFLTQSLPQRIASSRVEIGVNMDGSGGYFPAGGVPVFYASELVYDAQGRPLGHFKNYLRCDCYRLSLCRRSRGSHA